MRGGGVRLLCAVLGGAGLIATLALGAAPAGAGYRPPPVIPWETLFPGVPTLHNPQFAGVPGCQSATMACIDTEIANLDAVRVRFGCDHRGVFATTYELLTITLREDMTANPHLFDDPAWVIGEDVTFANLYFGAVSAYERGLPVAPAWRVAFDSAASGDDNAVQDMLLGINAHVQRDMPFMMAAVGLHTPSGVSRKHDHDVLNVVLNQAYQRVTNTITERFDPIEGFIAPRHNELLGYAGNIAGDQLVQLWRQEVWQNAQRLLNAPDQAAEQRVENSIEANALAWARGIAVIQVPGYRQVRDRYCAVHDLGPLTG